MWPRCWVSLVVKRNRNPARVSKSWKRNGVALRMDNCVPVEMTRETRGGMISVEAKFYTSEKRRGVRRKGLLLVRSSLSQRDRLCLVYQRHRKPAGADEGMALA